MSQFFIGSSGGTPPPSVLTQFTFDDGTHTIVSGNNVNINNGTGIVATANPDTSSSFIISAQTDSFQWSDQAVSFAALPQHGYFCTAALTVSLPTNDIDIGSTIIIYVDTASAVVIQAGAGQLIEISQNSSTVDGTATSTAQGNIVTLVYRTSDTTWHSISTCGTFTTA